MARSIFISYQRQDVNRARGFNLMKHSQYVDVNFRGRHLLTPVNSRNPSYIKSCVNKQMHGTSVTVVLLGEKTHQSNWVAWEIAQSIKRGNGVVAMRLKDQHAPLPPNSEVTRLLRQAGAEVLPWSPHGVDRAIERSFRASGRASAIANRSSRTARSGGALAGGGGQGCNR